MTALNSNRNEDKLNKGILLELPISNMILLKLKMIAIQMTFPSDKDTP
jgi:hypothetical protein